MIHKKYLLALVAVIFSFSAYAAEIVIPMHLTVPKGVGKFIGNVTVTETRYGLLFVPDLRGLPPGLHGFHIHQKPSCDDMGMAAGDHFDPQHTNKHLGPYHQGHEGDLPALFVAANGTATEETLAPRLKLSELSGHTLMIHEHGDNYSDHPAPNGGGGPRIACGIIPAISK